MTAQPLELLDPAQGRATMECGADVSEWRVAAADLTWNSKLWTLQCMR